MTLDKQIEQWLARLDRALSGISVSERAEIITEIKSHVVEAQSRDPSRTINAILDSFGEPETVANRYIVERGLKAAPAPKAPIVKWLTIGFLGTFGIFCITILTILFSFTPIIDVNEKEGRVKILGGLININAKDASDIAAGSFGIDDVKGEEIKGELKLDGEKAKANVNFTNGKFSVKTSSNGMVSWSCRFAGRGSGDPVTAKGSAVSFNFAKSHGVKCDIALPQGSNATVAGGNGKIYLDKPRFDVDLKVTNGKVGINPDLSQSYTYETSVVNGKSDITELTAAAKGTGKPWTMKIALVNGVIGKDD